ncbi:DNA-binding response regulator [Rhodococcus sp. 06-412-2C]|uniref:response regulator transcription factor n=1 Tax=unclassified Rhodococcus (in: high G+C Gram-positive bacteria) TaxID=192944 RepID=UPI000B9A43F8|nr:MULTISPECIES: response regulator transcription factor [unclassified Rhodococcus (in: high G+C Gram-positive bacteria)]OZC87393.1 DNA-binding response regulator [Rhodococcus sp. 06-412-2C]OZD00833.1 DNA-binding response regulator [Rhodococcus sp. 06-412-2B]
MNIALVEDDDSVAAAVAAGLRRFGHRVAVFGRGGDLLLDHKKADFVILDLGLPDQDGMEVLRQLRTVTSIPVIVLTARGDERSVVRGLRLGADDYLVKPARLAELIARIDVIHRRSARDESTPVEFVASGDIVVDLTSRTVSVAGEPIALTTKEFAIVAMLVESPGAAVSREEILDRVWGDAFATVSRSLDVHVAGLRAKLQRPGTISTIRGFGYRWNEPGDG